MLPNLVLMLKSSYSMNCVYPILLYHTSHVIFGFREIPNSALHAVWKYLIGGEWQWTIRLNLCLIFVTQCCYMQELSCMHKCTKLWALSYDSRLLHVQKCHKIPSKIYVDQSAKCLYDFTTPNLIFLLLNTKYNCLMFQINYIFPLYLSKYNKLV